MTGIQTLQANGDLTPDAVLKNRIFRNIILSLVATYGLYIIASLMAFDPWHMRGCLCGAECFLRGEMG